MSEPIPQAVAEMLDGEEKRNVRDRNGWAVGTVVHRSEEGLHRKIEVAFIELFNGDGRAGEFGGVRFMAVTDDGDLEEAYAHATEEAAEANAEEPYWYVEEYTDPEDPDYGEPSP